MFSQLTSGAKALGLRFSIVALFPAALLSIYLFGLASIATADSRQDVIISVTQAAERFNATGMTLILAAAAVIAVVGEPFQIGIVRLLEGYWGRGHLGRFIGAYAVERQRRARYLLRLRRDLANFRAGGESDYAYLGQLERRYPRAAPLLPTLLGNTLRAGEESAGGRYGLDSPLAWPRLYGCLPESAQKGVAEIHQQIDAGARLTIVLAVAAATGCPILLPHGWWNAVWIVLAVLAVIAYRGTVTAAAVLRPVLESCFDLGRFDMLRALHIQLPEDANAERMICTHLSEFWADEAGRGPLPPGQTYAHPGTQDPKADDIGVTTASRK